MKSSYAQIAMTGKYAMMDVTPTVAARSDPGGEGSEGLGEYELVISLRHLPRKIDARKTIATSCLSSSGD